MLIEVSKSASLVEVSGLVSSVETPELVSSVEAPASMSETLAGVSTEVFAEGAAVIKIPVRTAREGARADAVAGYREVARPERCAAVILEITLAAEPDAAAPDPLPG